MVSFDVGAEEYDRFMGRYSTPLAPSLADLAGVGAGQRVLDVGCGPGARTAELIRRPGPDAVSARRDRLRDRCRALLPAPPFSVTASAWAARGSISPQTGRR